MPLSTDFKQNLIEDYGFTQWQADVRAGKLRNYTVLVRVASNDLPNKR